MLHIVKPNEIDSVIGKDLGASEWMVIDQERIDKFADATMDHQFIHVDPKQAEPIFGSTIAHGFLSLSLVAGISFEQEIGMVFEGTKMGPFLFPQTPYQFLAQRRYQRQVITKEIHERLLNRK